jgi:hypothetical protein
LVIAKIRNTTFTEAIMKTIKRSELDGVTGWLSSDGEVRLCHIKARWFADGSYGTTLSDDKECKICDDTPLTGDSLIAALRERGVEVIDDTQPALGGPDDAAARKWADENGYEVVGYRLPKMGEQYIEYLNTPIQCVLASPKDFNHVRCYVLTPKAKPVESKPDKWAHLPEGGEWLTGTNDWLWHFPTRSNCGTCYIPSQQGKPASFGKGYAEWPGDNPPEYIRIISRAEAIAIFEANAKPEVKPTEADQLRKELDEAKATIGQYQAELSHWSKAATDKRQPPMSDERFRQEAAIAAMASLNQHADVVELAEKIVASGSPITVRQLIAGKAIEYADALLAAMKGGAQ